MCHKTDVEGQLFHTDFVGLGLLRVKHLGTITACFPYVDEDTKSILQAVMNEARNYDDFAERLCEKALKKNASALLTYFAYFHAYLQGKYKLLKRLMDARVGSDLTHPFELTYYARRGDPVKWSAFQKAMAAAVKMTGSDWMACHVYMAWREFIEFFYSADSDSDYAPLDILESKIKSDDEYNFFLASLHRIKATRLAAEGNIEEARMWYDQAISLATKHDDLEKLANLLFEKANMVKNVSLGEAVSILKVQKGICDRIGYVDAGGLNAHCLGHIAMARGEYDAAIDYQSEYIVVRESMGLPVGLMKCVVAFLYNLKGNGKAALELAIDGKKDMASSAVCFAQAQEAWALLNLDRIDEAARVLDEAKEASLKTGDEFNIGRINFIEGLIEKRNHEYSSALFSLEEALDIFDRLRGLAYINTTLVHMTDVEIEAYPTDRKAAKTEFSGPWMLRLMKQVEGRELPGFAAQALLLQAKFRFKQGRIAQSRRMLKRVLKTAEAAGLHYLKDMAEAVIPELLVS
ncbi:MAG: hypothetical protein C4K48_01230 [Candidatus Thorarchaeota archaeon]|nr:MAG: hypothetical protein C4K48_01230 [Candidatus Thorarchaeota archaeon]